MSDSEGFVLVSATCTSSDGNLCDTGSYICTAQGTRQTGASVLGSLTQPVRLQERWQSHLRCPIAQILRVHESIQFFLERACSLTGKQMRSTTPISLKINQRLVHVCIHIGTVIYPPVSSSTFNPGRDTSSVTEFGDSRRWIKNLRSALLGLTFLLKAHFSYDLGETK